MDLSRGKIYWEGEGGDAILRGNLDGSQVETLFTGVDDVDDIDIDESGGKLYWGGSDGILRANLDGSQAEKIVSVSTSGIAIDEGEGKIYWTDWIWEMILRANLDGSQVEIIVSGLDWDWPTDIALGP